jgi:hypothetical protein
VPIPSRFEVADVNSTNTTLWGTNGGNAPSETEPAFYTDNEVQSAPRVPDGYNTAGPALPSGPKKEADFDLYEVGRFAILGLTLFRLIKGN